MLVIQRFLFVDTSSTLSKEARQQRRHQLGPLKAPQSRRVPSFNSAACGQAPKTSGHRFAKQPQLISSHIFGSILLQTRHRCDTQRSKLRRYVAHAFYYALPRQARTIIPAATATRGAQSPRSRGTLHRLHLCPRRGHTGSLQIERNVALHSSYSSRRSKKSSTLRKAGSLLRPG